MGIVDFFSKKETAEEKKLKEKIMEAKMEKQQLNKKPVKKTSSKKTFPKTQKTKIEVKKEEEQIISSKLPSQPQTLVFFTQEIKRVYYKNQWYYCLEDLVGLTGKLKLEEYLKNLKNEKDYEEKKSEFIIETPIKISSQVKIIEFINKKGIINWLIPKLREDERYFPGPFPYWLNQVNEESPKTN